MKISFNTGRLYTALGQVITVLVLEDQNVTLFMDHSRGIGGKIDECPTSPEVHDIARWVMQRYDPGHYQADYDATQLERLDTIHNVRVTSR